MVEQNRSIGKVIKTGIQKAALGVTVMGAAAGVGCDYQYKTGVVEGKRTDGEYTSVGIPECTEWEKFRREPCTLTWARVKPEEFNEISVGEEVCLRIGYQGPKGAGRVLAVVDENNCAPKSPSQ